MAAASWVITPARPGRSVGRVCLSMPAGRGRSVGPVCLSMPAGRSYGGVEVLTHLRRWIGEGHRAGSGALLGRSVPPAP